MPIRVVEITKPRRAPIGMAFAFVPDSADALNGLGLALTGLHHADQAAVFPMPSAFVRR